MNPLIIIVLLFVMRGNHHHTMYIGNLRYLDTFRIELILDRLRTMTEAVDKMNRIAQIETISGERGGWMDRLETSLDVAKTFLANTKAETQIQQVSDVIGTVRGIGDPSMLWGILKEFDGK